MSHQTPRDPNHFAVPRASGKAKQLLIDGWHPHDSRLIPLIPELHTAFLLNGYVRRAPPRVGSDFLREETGMNKQILSALLTVFL
jgi:hypothetical protein